MLTLDPAWYDAISQRHSRRRYEDRALPQTALDALQSLCATARLVPGARVALIQSRPEVFTGLLKSMGGYGRVEGAPWTALFIAREGSEIEAGYVGEALILEATRLGLGTCWVSGMFAHETTQSLVPLARGESVVAVSPIGYPLQSKELVERMMTAAVRSHHRRPIEDLAPDLPHFRRDGQRVWPRWAIAAVEAARLAPSSANSQPWRFYLQGDTLIMTGAGKWRWPAPLDFGIAMLHVELGAAHEGVFGFWQRLPEPDVAGFTTAPEMLVKRRETPLRREPVGRTPHAGEETTSRGEP